MAAKHTNSFSLPLAMNMWFSHLNVNSEGVNNPWSQIHFSHYMPSQFFSQRNKLKLHSRCTAATSKIYIILIKEPSTRPLLVLYSPHKIFLIPIQHSHHRASLLPPSLLHFNFYYLDLSKISILIVCNTIREAHKKSELNLILLHEMATSIKGWYTSELNSLTSYQ